MTSLFPYGAMILLSLVLNYNHALSEIVEALDTLTHISPQFINWTAQSHLLFVVYILNDINKQSLNNK
jgi:hypothetical protein